MSDKSAKTARRSRNEEARLDRKIKALYGKGPENYSASDWASMREQLRLTLLYPGRYVAHRDHYTSKGSVLRLVHREVLFVTRTLPRMHKRLASLSEAESLDVMLVYMDAGDLFMNL